MNEPSVYSTPSYGCHIGWFRLSWKAEAFQVRTSKDGPVRYFGTPDEAELAAHRVKAKIEDRKFRRWGEMTKSAKSEAEAIFRPGKKAIPVERKRA